MKVLIATLREELSTVERLERKCIRSLQRLPKGSFVLRVVRGRRYGYLTFRDGPKVRQRYLGCLSEEEVRRRRVLAAKRKQYKRQLKSLGIQKKILIRALRGQAD
jgi:hypothetical protein